MTILTIDFNGFWNKSIMQNNILFFFFRVHRVHLHLGTMDLISFFVQKSKKFPATRGHRTRCHLDTDLFLGPILVKVSRPRRVLTPFLQNLRSHFASKIAKTGFGSTSKVGWTRLFRPLLMVKLHPKLQK